MTENKTGFKKSLKLVDSTALVIGSMIGSGIFIVSADMSRTLGSPGWLLIAWAITGVLTIIAALSYGELASLMPHAGGQYVYLREAYNPLSGFLYGWSLFLVIQTGTIAAVAMAFGKFLGVLIPWFSESNVWLELGFIKLNTVHIIAISSIVILTWINTRGITVGKYIQNTFTFTKVGILLAFILIGLFLAKNTDAIAKNAGYFWDAQQTVVKQIDGKNITEIFPVSGFLLIAILATSLVGSLFSADAWNNITFAGAEVVNPKRNIPLSLFLGTLIVSVLYILTNYVYMQVLPLRGLIDGSTVFDKGIGFATDGRVGTAAMYGIFGVNAAIIMAVMIIISTIGCNNGLILSGARVYYAMANDKVFFKRVGALNSKGVPAMGLVLQCVWACILCLSGKYSDLLDYVVFAVLIFYVMTILGIFILRFRKPDLERSVKAFGYPFLPAIYIISCSFIMIMLLIYKPGYTWPGLIIVLLGIPVYYIWRSINKKE